MSISRLIEMSRRSFRTLDAAMNTVGQNVANAETEGYARRRITMQSDSVIAPGIHNQSGGLRATGAGVSMQTFERMRDTLLVRSGWESQSALGFSEERHRVLGALESLFPAGSDGALNKQLEQFFTGWQDLAGNPTSTGARNTVRSQAAGLASTLNRLSRGLSDLRESTETALQNGVDDVNTMLDELGALNGSIVQARRAGSPDLSAEDRRDLLMKDLAEMLPVRVQDGPDGFLNVSLDGKALVQEQKVQKLTLDDTTTPPTIGFENLDVTWRRSGSSGKLDGLLTTLADELPDTQAKLDTLAQTLVEQVNAVHQGGTNLQGNTGVDFFDAAGTSAATIQLSTAVEGGAAAIAASVGDPTDGYGDSQTADGIYALRDGLLFDGGTSTPEGFVLNLIGGIGSAVSSAATQYEGQAAVAGHLEAMERGVSGVSIEEEMTKLIEYQQSFQAAARLINTAQDMFDTMLSL